MAGFSFHATANRHTKTVTIANGASLSGAVFANGETLVAVITPSGWTSAALSFQASADGVTYANMIGTDGNEVATSGSIPASSYVPLDPADFSSCEYIKVRSGTAAAAVNQAGGDTLTLVFRGV